MEMLTPLKNPRKHLIFWDGCVIIKVVDTVCGYCINRTEYHINQKSVLRRVPAYLAQSAFLCIEKRLNKYETN